jgi:glycerol kinase
MGEQSCKIIQGSISLLKEKTMERDKVFVLGIDLGTQGVRSLIVNLRGKIVAEEKEGPFSSHLEGEIFEQDPEEWVQKVEVCVSKVLRKFADCGYSPEAILALSCDSTSGTVLLVDKEGRALHPAIMYNDSRAREEASFVNSVAKTFCDKMGYRFDPSFALCKVLWVKRHKMELFEKTSYFLHAADYLVGVLTGEWGISDISNSLKMGYDLIDLQWPEFIERELHIPVAKLPKVFMTGEVIGELLAPWRSQQHRRGVSEPFLSGDRFFRMGRTGKKSSPTYYFTRVSAGAPGRAFTLRSLSGPILQGRAREEFPRVLRCLFRGGGVCRTI